MMQIAPLWVLLIGAPALADPAPLHCRIVAITDGDTVNALCPGNELVKIRLAEIDAPEKKQPFGQASKQSLSDLCYNKDAEITPQKHKDRYGRTIARIMCAGVDANAEQVRRGMAWVYDKYVKNMALYPIQNEATAARRGLWADDAIPPWEWRHRGKRQ